MIWLIKTASDGTVQGPWDRVGLGFLQVQLPEVPCPAFATLPEWMIDDICDFFLFVFRFKPQVFERQSLDEIVTFAMVFLMNGTYLKNPYLKSKLVEILFMITLPLYRSMTGEESGKLDSVFGTNPSAKTYLIPSVLEFYVNVEQTGTFN